jgi:hypothetical protein
LTATTKLPKIENSSDFDENWYTTVILHVEHGKNKEKIYKKKLTSLGGH